MTENAALARMVRFAMSGAFTTILFFALSNFFYFSGMLGSIAASTLAYAISVVVSYGLQSRYTFRVSSDRPAQVAGFLMTSFAGLGVSYVIAWFTARYAFPHVAGVAAVCVLIPLANYLVFDRWVFADRAKVPEMERHD